MGGEFSDAGGLAGDGSDISGCFATGDVYTVVGGTSAGASSAMLPVASRTATPKETYRGQAADTKINSGELTGYEEARGPQFIPPAR